MIPIREVEEEQGPDLDKYQQYQRLVSYPWIGKFKTIGIITVFFVDKRETFFYQLGLEPVLICWK